MLSSLIFESLLFRFLVILPCGFAHDKWDTIFGGVHTTVRIRCKRLLVRLREIGGKSTSSLSPLSHST